MSDVPPSDERQDPSRLRREIREVIAVSAWVVVCLVALDVAVNMLFAYPKDPTSLDANSLAAYFDYGRSIEAKVRRLVGPTDSTSSPRAKDGWIGYARRDRLPDKPERDDGTLGTICGMSFTNQVAFAMERIDPRLTLRRLSGPSAPASHTYANYVIDRGGRSKFVIFGVLASAVRGMAAMNGMTWRFDGPSPYTYPRYHPLPNTLGANWPSVRSLDALRTCLADRSQWDAYLRELSLKDEYYNPLLFRQNLTDASVFMRMIKRVLAQRHEDEVTRRLHSPTGYPANSEEIRTVRVLLTSFAAMARSDGKLPLVLLLNDQGYADHLYRELHATLELAKIPYVSTHEICPATDPRNFGPDNHFTAACNREIAQRVIDEIHRQGL